MYTMSMQTALILSQIIFYFTVSIALILSGVLLSMAMYHLMRIAKELEKMTRDFHEMTAEAQEKIRDLIDRLSDLPILSFFLKQKRSSRGGNGRGRAKD